MGVYPLAPLACLLGAGCRPQLRRKVRLIPQRSTHTDAGVEALDLCLREMRGELNEGFFEHLRWEVEQPQP